MGSSDREGVVIPDAKTVLATAPESTDKKRSLLAEGPDETK